MEKTVKKNLTIVIKVIILACSGMILVGCGTVSDLEKNGDSAMFNAKGYSRVTVLDFKNEAHTNKTKKDAVAEYNESVEIAGRLFADKIAAELKKQNLFAEVVRGEVEEPCLVIYGSIVRYAEGNAAARLFIGLGAGSSYFDANVKFSDNETGTELAIMKVDKNSWVLGGGIAAGQTVEGYMDKAAKKISEELAKALQQPITPRSGS